jgi:hypothetical protein
MAQENPSWGEERIADELSLKLGLFVDSRTIGKYLKQGGRPRQPSGQRCATFLHNHASAVVACDFFTSVTATFHVLYVFVAIEIGSRRILLQRNGSSDGRVEALARHQQRTSKPASVQLQWKTCAGFSKITAITS